MISKAPSQIFDADGRGLLRFIREEFFPVYFRGGSHDTKRTYEQASHCFSEWLNRKPYVADLTAKNLSAFWDWGSVRFAKGTMRTALQRLRTLWRAAERAGYLSEPPPDPYWWRTGLPPVKNTCAESQPPPSAGELLPMPKPLAPGERPETPAAFVPYYVLERGLKKSSARSVRYRMAAFARFLGRPIAWADLNDVTVNTWLAAMVAAGKDETARGNRNCVLAIWRAAFEASILDEQPRRIRKIKKRSTRPRCWTMDDLRALLRSCEMVAGNMNRSERQVARRDFWRAYVLVGYYTGLRLSDLLDIDWTDISADGVLTRIQNKTGDLVQCPLPPDCMEALKPLRGERQKVFGNLIARKRVFEMFKRLVTAAGLTGTSKWLRRSGASHVERMTPGCAPAFLGHRSDISLARQSYIDPTVAQRLKPLPPTIDDRMDETAGPA